MPEIIESEGYTPVYTNVSGRELLLALAAKLHEEAHELEDEIRASNTTRVVAELADIYEILFGIADSLSISSTDIEAYRYYKKCERGSFHDGVIMHAIEEKISE